MATTQELLDALRGIEHAPNQGDRGKMGVLADTLRSADNFARRPFGYQNPPVDYLSDFLGVPTVIDTADKLSRGQDVGGWQAAETALALSPLAGPAVRGVKALGKVLPKNLPVGMSIYDPSIGGMSSNINDAKKVADQIQSLGKQYIPSIDEASGGSVYLTVKQMPLTKSGEIAKNRTGTPLDFKARFADHPSYWGSTISSDPVTRNTTDKVVEMFRHKIGQIPEPNYSQARFNPADKYGEVEDVLHQQGLSLKGNPVVKRIIEKRPITFLDNNGNR